MVLTTVWEIVQDDQNINSHFHHLFSFEGVLSQNAKLKQKSIQLFQLF